jgi:hypothetical protein
MKVRIAKCDENIQKKKKRRGSKDANYNIQMIIHNSHTLKKHGTWSKTLLIPKWREMT